MRVGRRLAIFVATELINFKFGSHNDGQRTFARQVVELQLTIVVVSSWNHNNPYSYRLSSVTWAPSRDLMLASSGSSSAAR
jgi:hypothetical protein